jgi:hypothetical protein
VNSDLFNGAFGGVLVEGPEDSKWEPRSGWDEPRMRERAVALQASSRWRWTGGDAGWPCRPGDEQSFAALLELPDAGEEEAADFFERVGRFDWAAYSFACGNATGAILSGRLTPLEALAWATLLTPRPAPVAVELSASDLPRMRREIDQACGAGAGGRWLDWIHELGKAPERSTRRAAFEAAARVAGLNFESAFGEFRLPALSFESWSQQDAQSHALTGRVALLAALQERDEIGRHATAAPRAKAARM